MPARCSAFTIPLNSRTCSPRRAGRGVQRVRREVADRRVAPVVRQPEVVQEALVRDVVDRQQLDRGDSEPAEVRQRLLGCEPGVLAAQVVAHARVQSREPLHVHLVDDGVGPRGRGRPVVLPVEVRVDHDALRNRVGVVLRVTDEVRVLGAARHVRKRVSAVPLHRPLDRLRVGVDQQLVRVEAVTRARIVRTVDAVPVALPGPDAGNVAMPVERRALGQLDTPLAIVVVEQAELDALRVLREERKVRSLSVPRRAEGKRPAGPDVHDQRPTA